MSSSAPFTTRATCRRSFELAYSTCSSRRCIPTSTGNGRLGRLLITLLLRHWDLLSRPLLYLSLFLKTHRDEYYRRLAAVRTDGDWEGWLGYFLEGVAVVADEAVVDRSPNARDRRR